MFKLSEDDIVIKITDAYDIENKSPSPESHFSTKRFYDLYDFKQECEDLAESINGYYEIEESNSIDFIARFYTFDDSDEIEGEQIGYVLFKMLVEASRNTLSYFD